MYHLLATPRGLTLADVIIAKRNTDGSFAVKGHEKYIHAQLQAAYGKKISPQAIGYITRGCELLAQVPDHDLENSAYPFHPNPHALVHRGDDFSILAKGHMMFSLTGLNDMEEPMEGRERLLKMQRTLRPDALLKSYGLPTWEELAKDAGDDSGDDEDDDSGNSDGGDDDASDGLGGGNSHYNPDEPRIPAGQPGGGQWTTAGNGISTDSGSISADDIRSALIDGFNNPSALPQGTDVAANMLVSNDADNGFAGEADLKDRGNPIAADPAVVTLNDGSAIPNPFAGGFLLMPAGVNLQTNAELGEWLATLDSATRAEMMINYFERGGAMDYQRQHGPDRPVTRGYVDFGNFNFGVVAAAAGYTYNEAIMAAAAENITGSGRKNGPWGSNPDNNYFILQGYNAYKNGRIK